MDSDGGHREALMTHRMTFVQKDNPDRAARRGSKIANTRIRVLRVARGRAR
jgi:hypothetical protein